MSHGGKRESGMIDDFGERASVVEINSQPGLFCIFSNCPLYSATAATDFIAPTGYPSHSSRVSQVLRKIEI